MRADKLVFARGISKSRREAQALIEEGKIFCNGTLITKPSCPLDDNAELTLIGEAHKYVSRGGLKLSAALEAFGVSVTGAVCTDIGASTGGFTDCLLQYGASRVYAVEGGHGQLAPSLLADGRVVSIEGKNARELELSDIGQLCDIVTMDVSFISQTLLHEKVAMLLKKDGLFISLIKPQFEAGRHNIGKHGIAKPEAIPAVLENVRHSASENGLNFKSVIMSPIKGGDGNTEYLALFVRE